MNSYRVKRNVKKFLFLLMVLLIIVTLMLSLIHI